MMIPSSSRLKGAIFALFALTLCADAHAHYDEGDSAFGVRFDGATILPYAQPGDVGNGVQLVLTLDHKALQIGLAAGAVLPASRTEAAFPALQLSVGWHPWRDDDWAHRTLLSPYVSLGIGFAPPDTLEEEDEGTSELVRWVTGEPEPLVQLGIGVTYGAEDGIYLLAEARAVNHTHLAMVMGGGARF